MAVAKIKPIRGTVSKALVYILDTQKTDDAFYVSSFGVLQSDAAAKEFEWTKPCSTARNADAEAPSQNKGMDYKEYTEAKRGTSWKQKAQADH